MSTTTCMRCDGDGLVEVWHDAGLFLKEPCSNCDGTGIDDDHEFWIGVCEGLDAAKSETDREAA